MLLRPLILPLEITKGLADFQQPQTRLSIHIDHSHSGGNALANCQLKPQRKKAFGRFGGPNFRESTKTVKEAGSVNPLDGNLRHEDTNRSIRQMVEAGGVELFALLENT
jgi:hypothetical protein